MNRVIIHITIDDVSDEEVVKLKQQFEEVTRDTPRVTMDVTMRTVPERPV